MKRILLSLMIMPLIAMASLSYAEEFIVHDEEDGTITVYSQDKSYGITIQDKNLGASVAGTGEESYGYYFQFGNNHGNYAGTNTGKLNELLDEDYRKRYHKGYSGENRNFIIFNHNNNMSYDYRSGSFYIEGGYYGYPVGLWGGEYDGFVDVEDVYDTINHIYLDVAQRQGPCPEGYHVPSWYVWEELIKLYANAKGLELYTGWGAFLSGDGMGTAFSNDLLLPLAGMRHYYNGEVIKNGGDYWMSSETNENDPSVMFFNTNIIQSTYTSRARGLSIRCFKNSHIPLPKTLNFFFMSSTGDVQEVGTGEVTENMTGAVPEKAKNVTKTGYELLGWIRSGATTTEIFDFETTPISGDWADDDGKVYFIAQWTGIKYSVEFTGTDVEGTMPMQELTYDITGALTSNAFTKNGYTFSGWTDSEGNKYTDGQEVINLTTTSGEVITLTAEWTKNKTSGGSSGGGGSMRKDNCPDGDFSPSYYDGECGEKPHGSAETNTLDEIPQPQQPEQTPVDPQSLPPTETSPGKGQTSSEGQNTELADMHKRAYENGLTIYKPGEDAKFDQPLTRQQMAKISSIFGAKFLNQKADVSEGKIMECSQYKDLSKSKGEMRGYVIQSCLMKNMGYAYDNVNYIPKFKPYDKMSVAQASVILSRMAWGTKYVISPKMWYQGHMQAVYDHGLIDDISDPSRKITRGEAFMMMYRLDKLMNESEKI